MSWSSWCPICKADHVFNRELQVCTSCLYERANELWERCITEEKLEILCLVRKVKASNATSDTILSVYRTTVLGFSNLERAYCEVCEEEAHHCIIFGCVSCSDRRDERIFKSKCTHEQLEYLKEHATLDELVLDQAYKYKG